MPQTYTMLYVNYINKTGENNILKSNLKGFGSMSMCLPYYKDHNRVQRMTVNF